MQFEFQINSQLKAEERETANMMESAWEDRKDSRVDRQAGHQMNMIEKRKEDDSLKKFESSGNDIVTGDAGLNL